MRSSPPLERRGRRRRAGIGAPVWSASMDPSGNVSLAESRGPREARRKCRMRGRRAFPPHQRNRGPAEGRAPHAHQCVALGAADRFSLWAHVCRPEPDRAAALPRARPDRRCARDARIRRCGDRPAPFLRLPLLEIVPQPSRELVLRRADHPPDPARARHADGAPHGGARFIRSCWMRLPRPSCQRWNSASRGPSSRPMASPKRPTRSRRIRSRLVSASRVRSAPASR